MLAACWTADILLINKLNHLLVGPAINRAIQFNTVILTEILDQLICSESLMTFFTIHQRIREAAQMAGCDPCLRIHQNRTINTYIIRIFLDIFLPPGFFYIVL